MVKAYPEEFRRDVIAVARKGETSVRQVAKDFGVSESCLARWLRLADRDDGIGVAGAPSLNAATPRRRNVERSKQLTGAFRVDVAVVTS
ncbi:transposase [Curtobacterium sp. MCBD17_032]|uniref:transposase n=1 Tax=Curtobacterium sp. MCBD17_032 TaxID=2175659 RepID=UPI001C64722A|nr:transposase [Curtobacterium sp. MCBD17_032]